MVSTADRIRITSWAQIQERIQFIVERLNANPSLALAAAVNPLYALEELGLDIDPAVRPAIEQRVRFKPRVNARMQHLREEIFRHAGHSFDIDSPREVECILFDRLGLALPASESIQNVEGEGEGEGAKRPPALTLSRPVRTGRGDAPAEDPLEPLRDAHPIVPPLLEYRRLDANAPRLAPRSLYDEVRRGERQFGVVNLHFRLKTQPP